MRVRSVRVRWGLGAAVVLWGLMALDSGYLSWAASRQVFPDLRVRERLHDADIQGSGTIEALYLYGTLSLLERRDGPYRIDIVGVEHPELLPLATFDIYPEIPTYIQSEFSNYTIWGVLDDAMFHDALRAMSTAADAVARRQPASNQLTARRRLGLGVNPLGESHQFDLRSDHTFGAGEMARLHGEQRQFYAKADYYAGRGGVDYHQRGVIAQTLKRILAFANALMDNKVLAISLFGVVVLVAKVAQGIMSRPS